MANFAQAGASCRYPFLTRKERDNETGLDFFGARYYGSMMGRFTSADPLLTSGRPSNPQTWNRYSYTLGNPLKYVDPLGLFEWDASLKDDPNLSDKERKRRGQLRDAFINARDKARADAAKAHDAGKLSDEKFKAINDALNAYGPDPGQVGSNDDVTVGVGTQKGGPGETDAQFTYNRSADGTGGTLTPNISVRFDANLLRGKGAEYGVAHEGSHVGSAEAFAKVWTGYRDAGGPLDLTDYANENIAYHVTSYLLEGNRINGSSVGIPAVWENDWGKTNVDAQTQQANIQRAIDTTLAGSPYYVTPTSQGDRLSSHISKIKMIISPEVTCARRVVAMINYVVSVLLFSFCFQSVFSSQAESFPGLQGKVSSDERFNKLPPAVRADLFSRLGLYVQYRRSHQWAQLYDLYWKQYIAGENGLRGVTKEQFTEQGLQRGEKPIYELVNFRPLDAQVMSNEREEFMVVKIEGCGEYTGLDKVRTPRPNGPNQKLESVVTAVFQDGTWFFTDIAIGPRCFDCPPQPCCPTE